MSRRSLRVRRVALGVVGVVVLSVVLLVGVSVIHAPSVSTVETPAASTENAPCAGCVTFPTISGENLPGQGFTLPADFAGDPVLVIVPFDEAQQQQAQSWLPIARELADAQAGFGYYDVPVFPNTAAPFRVVIRAGLNVAISDEALRAVTITVFLDDLDPFLDALAIPDVSTMQAFLLDGDGNVIWRGAGAFTDQQGASLRAAVEEYAK